MRFYCHHLQTSPQERAGTDKVQISRRRKDGEETLELELVMCPQCTTFVDGEMERVKQLIGEDHDEAVFAVADAIGQVLQDWPPGWTDSFRA